VHRSNSHDVEVGSGRYAAACLAVAKVLDPGLVTRRVRVANRDVVLVKGILDASEGIGALFAERGGQLLIATTPSRVSELDELLRDLVVELSAVLEER
jgi:Domain of unknown function (DUF4911)